MNGEALTFGNQGALYMSAMTWWDHKTGSVWSQPWGTAIAGPLEGTALTLIPVSTVPWSTWLELHPGTTIMVDGLGTFGTRAERSTDDFVIGVAMGASATAYPYKLAARLGVINDHVGDHPVAVFVDPETRNINVYLRRPGSELPEGHSVSEIQFETDTEGRVLDVLSGSVWDVSRGIAVEGPLKGVVLQQLPYVTSFDWAWRDFFPHTTFFGEE